MRAALYGRVSTAEQAEKYGLDSQLRALRQLVAERGWQVAGEYVDDGYSGADLERPKLALLREAARAGAFDVVVAHDPDRLSRKLAHQLIVTEEFARVGVAVAFVTTPTEDTSEGRLLLHVKGVIAEYEREKIRIRTQRGIREKIERGLIVGKGFPPFGYQFTRDQTGRVVGLDINPETAPIARRIITRLRVRSIPIVCEELNAESIPTRTGKPWRHNTVLDLMRNPVYIGRYYHGRTRQPKENGKKRINLRLIEGVEMPPPEPGHRWAGKDIMAGIALAQLLNGQPAADEVWRVSVLNYANRVDAAKAQLVMLTQYRTEVRWGEPVNVDFHVELTPAQKLQRMQQLKAQYGRVDARYSWIDIRFDKVMCPVSESPTGQANIR